MFRTYLGGTSVLEINPAARQAGMAQKQWTTREGKFYGGSPLRRCQKYNLLGNILYTGRVKVGDEIFSGEHEGIITLQTFDLAQARLKANAWTPGKPESHQDGLASAGDDLLFLLRVGHGFLAVQNATGS
jgi:hypothetical protein